jgi:hypothetical protein
MDSLANTCYQKPKDVTDPMGVDSSEFQSLIALMVQEQFYARGSEEFVFYPKVIQYHSQWPQAAFVWCNPVNARERKYLTDEHHNTLSVEWVTPAKDTAWVLKAGEALPSGLGIVARSSTWKTKRFKQRILPAWFDDSMYENASDIPSSAYIEEWVESEPIPPTADLQCADILRWERVLEAIESIEGQIRKPEFFHPDHRQVRYPDRHFHDAFTRTAGNFQYVGDSRVDPDQILQFVFRSPILLTLLLVLPAVYGGVHLSASISRFPTYTELLLWKLSSINIIATMPVFFLLTFVGSWVSKLCFRYESLAEDVWATLYKLPGHLLIFSYVVARSYLVIESFISLRALPIGAFWTPSWLQMIPHV